MELARANPIFVGFKLDGNLRRQLEAVSGPDRRYLSPGESFLSICRRGEDVYVGKVIEDGLSTDRVEDVKRNVLSIVRRLVPDVRLPQHLDILVCLAEQGGPAAEPRNVEGPPSGGPSRADGW